MLHRYADYLLMGTVDPIKSYNSSDLLHFIQHCATPEASGSTVQTIEDRYFYECPLKDLDPNKAWMWRSYHEHCLKICREAAKSQNKLPVSETALGTSLEAMRLE